jgi:hypothetical protein
VKFEGKPMVGGGSIALMPLTNQEGMTAGGEIAPDGTYKLSTYGTHDGSMLGEFRVLITQVTAQEPKNTEDGEAPATATSAVAEADRIPDIYADPSSSPLTIKVEAKPNQFDFDLKRDGK